MWIFIKFTANNFGNPSDWSNFVAVNRIRIVRTYH